MENPLLMAQKEKWKPTPLKIGLSLIIAFILLLLVIKIQSCPEREFLLCGQPAKLHEPVWGCTFYCTTAVKDYFLYAFELGMPFFGIFIVMYILISVILSRNPERKK